MKKLTHVRNAIYGQPWAITENSLSAICEIFEAHVASPDMAAENFQPKEKQAGYEVVNGVAIIPIMGPLFPHANLMTRLSGATSYDGISSALNDALNRLDVGAVILSADSPGGAVSGCFELASEIFAAQQHSEKKIIGHISGSGQSGAYLLLSQCEYLACTEGSLIGSVGVITKMENTDRMDRNAGNDSVVIRSKELKAPGSGPITPNQVGSINRIVMKFDAMFEETVLRARRGVNKEKAFTAESFVGQDAVDLGLCDDVCTLDDLISQYGTTVF